MTDETKRIVEWLRSLDAEDRNWTASEAGLRTYFADAIERGDHLKDKTE
jgi:hypothetical protein